MTDEERERLFAHMQHYLSPEGERERIRRAYDQPVLVSPYTYNDLVDMGLAPGPKLKLPSRPDYL